MILDLRIFIGILSAAGVFWPSAVHAERRKASTPLEVAPYYRPIPSFISGAQSNSKTVPIAPPRVVPQYPTRQFVSTSYSSPSAGTYERRTGQIHMGILARMTNGRGTESIWFEKDDEFSLAPIQQSQIESTRWDYFALCFQGSLCLNAVSEFSRPASSEAKHSFYLIKRGGRLDYVVHDSSYSDSISIRFLAGLGGSALTMRNHADDEPAEGIDVSLSGTLDIMLWRMIGISMSTTASAGIFDEATTGKYFGSARTYRFSASGNNGPGITGLGYSLGIVLNLEG
jgi:hypothetical protein